ncbi:putative transcriptional regulatory protein [Colletotrichum sidae]|uniref:Putative transcriptional regulatory protein n=1 Tax=Colletotrichum sidae TaxID=1347389 RepID=A0A4R8T8W3_9PEZI|nr:putative transcriptional regulatory protein [Colletotrichum sidae]
MDTAFATRFRQVMSDLSASQQTYIPRNDFASDERSINLAEATCPWPSPPKARLLIEVALRIASGCFHIVRKSCVLDAVEMSHSNSSSNQIPTWKDYSVKGKIWALFAMGELYSSRTTRADHDFPGLHYFAKATKILNYLGERPTMDLLETRLILSLYSLAVNRQYAAYTLVGSSVRMAIIMGLHISITPDQLDDAAVREHRTRLWWTAHVMDCLFSSRLGHRPTVHEDDIKASLPREIEAAEATSADFSDASYFTANAKLSVIMTRIICSVYGSPTGSGNLSERVKQALDDLSLWTRDLPPELHSENTTTSKRCNLGLVYLRLTLNQAVILSTRPILLYGLRNIWTTAKPSTGPHGVQSIRGNQSAMLLIESCVRCARHSCSTLIQSWIDGLFPAFDPFLTQHLFSALTILAISSLFSENESGKDREQLEQSAQLLSQLKDGGNFVAQELHQHVGAILAGLIEIQSWQSCCATNSESNKAVATSLRYKSFSGSQTWICSSLTH